MIQTQRIVVIYDSITNSVFISQVLNPLLAWLNGDKKRTATVISFEAIDITNHPTRARIAQEKRITLIIRKRIPFFGRLSLVYAAAVVRRIAKKKPTERIIARGPFAGYACLQARLQTPLLIQIRGLAAHEYAYTHEKQLTKERGIMNLIRRCHYRAKLRVLKRLETELYAGKNSSQLTFEAVSPALREYLLATYPTLHPQAITLAYEDIPQPVPLQKRKQWRLQTRAELAIPVDAQLYCYNGSAKPWQCPDSFFAFCRTEIALNGNAHLLILSHDYEEFARLMPQTQIPPERYHIVSVPHDKIYQYLAAADTGILFRDATLLNWVSRPTKVLEYQAVGLTILHNATIAWLAESARNQKVYMAPPER